MRLLEFSLKYDPGDRSGTVKVIILIASSIVYYSYFYWKLVSSRAFIDKTKAMKDYTVFIVDATDVEKQIALTRNGYPIFFNIGVKPKWSEGKILHCKLIILYKKNIVILQYLRELARLWIEAYETNRLTIREMLSCKVWMLFLQKPKS